MARCDVCGERPELPHQCNQCDETFCGSHRLPEAHDCGSLSEWADPDGFGANDPDQSRETFSRGSERSEQETLFGRVVDYLDGNVTYLFLAVMTLTLLMQTLILPFLGGDVETWYAIFTVSAEHPEYVWTWFTSIFAHGGMLHLLTNGVLILFFGRLVEEYLGSKRYTLFFLGSGAIAGLAQVGLVAMQGGTARALGASGAAFAIMGILMALNPRLRVYVFFFFPVPVWLFSGGWGVLTLWYIQQGGIGAGGVGQLAHFGGLVVGLLYGLYLKGRSDRLPDELRFGRRERS